MAQVCFIGCAYVRTKKLRFEIPSVKVEKFRGEDENSGKTTTKRMIFSTPAFFTGRFGNGVRSYFSLLRWLFLLNLYIFILVFCFVVIPMVVFENHRNSDATISSQPGSVSNGEPLQSQRFKIHIIVQLQYLHVIRFTWTSGGTDAFHWCFSCCVRFVWRSKRLTSNFALRPSRYLDKIVMVSKNVLAVTKAKP